MAKVSYRVTLDSVEVLTPTVKVFRLRFGPKDEFDFIAGQYVVVDVPRDDGVIQKAYSIASSPAQRGIIDLCIKHVEGGYASTYFHQTLQVGSVVTIYEAQGFFIDRPTDRERVYVATGTGIAPIRSMIQALDIRATLPPMSLFFGVRYEDEILYEAEWRRLAAERPAFRFFPTVSRPKTWTGDIGRVQDLLRKYLTDPQHKEVYVCGVVPMVKEVKPLLMESGVPRTQIHTEKYT